MDYRHPEVNHKSQKLKHPTLSVYGAYSLTFVNVPKGTVSLHGGVHTRRWISIGDFMASLTVPSLYSAMVLVQLHPAAVFTEVAPWRGILAVEPDIAVLNAKSLLLTRANYSVITATNEGDLFSLQTTKAFALAILSDRLGKRLLGAAAQIVRKQWPRARILIMGEVPRMLEDYLYDEQIYRSSDPQQVLADLEQLYEGMWNQGSKSIDWNSSRSAPCSTRLRISESYPTKAS